MKRNTQDELITDVYRAILVYQAEMKSPEYRAKGEEDFEFIGKALAAKGYCKSTADVVEVRRGRWINNHCTVCGQTPIGEEAWTRLGLTPPRFELCMSFCPCCGAKMDGERREEE